MARGEIILERSVVKWQARFVGAARDSIMSTFGTDVLALPWFHWEDAAVVQAEMAKRNPEYTVTIGGYAADLPQGS